MSQMKRLHICINGIHSLVYGPKLLLGLYKSICMQTPLNLTGMQMSHQILSMNSPGLCKYFSNGLSKGFSSVPCSLEKTLRGDSLEIFSDVGWLVELLLNRHLYRHLGHPHCTRIFGSVSSSQHFPLIGMAKIIRCRLQNRCLFLPKHCEKHPS